MSLSARLQQLHRRMTFSVRPRLQAPLLNETEMLALRQQALASPLSLMNPRDSQHTQLGEFSSPQRGSGMDFDESRPYVAGDDRRFINWRLLARTGEMHLKLFHEERRSQLFVVMDRRAGMRMGSQGSLKVTQAARLASLISCLAHKEAMALGAAVMNLQTHWHRPLSGEKALHRLLQEYIAPAPPLEQRADTDLQQVLSQLKGQLPAGSVVVIISDFAELDESHEALLWALVSDHRVIALQLQDPLEQVLPKQKGLYFRDDLSDSVLALDGRDQVRSEAYRVLMSEHQEAIRQRLVSLGLQHHLFSTTDDLLDGSALWECLHGE